MDPSWIPGGSLLDPRGCSLWVATFFYCFRSGKSELGRMLTDQAPQLTHHIRQLMVSLSNFLLHALCFHVFFYAPRPRRKHIFEDRPTPFYIQKYHFSDPQLEFKIISFVSLLVPTTPLFGRFGFFFALGANRRPTWVQLVPT